MRGLAYERETLEWGNRVLEILAQRDGTVMTVRTRSTGEQRRRGRPGGSAPTPVASLRSPGPAGVNGIQLAAAALAYLAADTSSEVAGQTLRRPLD
jgi:hypothetical protein